ncbi:hypothetical protein G9F32_03070 [Acinetobacter sp. 194]|uniref:hypothetical protein n=1 Tax=Acinetobacter shaoyimingii TaxID=2715164 RepID=UPI00140E45E0|nr:hypothetical protein [Acinetobacter shaoyimingii]NHB57014.1 hypothetical protein [Acinetobacter shaoyimingii]
MPKPLSREEQVATRNAARIYDERMHGIAAEFKPSVRVAWLSTVIFKAGAEINAHMADHEAYCKHVDELADAMKQASRDAAPLLQGAVSADRFTYKT